MNSILFYPEEVGPGGDIELRGVRARHAVEDFHDVAEGISLPASILGGARGRATYRCISSESVKLLFQPTAEPLPRSPFTLVVAVSRPQTIKKVIQAGVFLGIERLLFVRTELTQRSYLSSRELRPERIAHEIERALEQCCDSVAPIIEVHRALRDVLESEPPRRWAFFADTPSPEVPSCRQAPDSCRGDPSESVILAIGPEKGWSSHEQKLFREAGFLPLSLGERVLRVDAAVYVAVTALTPFLIVPST